MTSALHDPVGHCPTSAERPDRAAVVSKPFDPRHVLRAIDRLSS